MTRRPEQASTLVSRLTELGATVIEIPAIAVAPPEDTTALDSALARLGEYDWLIFTSANAVRAVAERLAALGGAAACLPLPRPRVASVGPSTSDAIADRFVGRAADLLPASEFRGEGLLAAFAERERTEATDATSVRGRRCLLPVADRARDVLAAGLRQLGAEVEVLVAYRTVMPPDLPELIAARLRGGVDLALFASPSAVENFAAAAGNRVHGLPTAVMGPVTERTARDLGLEIRAVASPSTLEGLISAARRALGEGPA